MPSPGCGECYPGQVTVARLLLTTSSGRVGSGRVGPLVASRAGQSLGGDRVGMIRTELQLHRNIACRAVRRSGRQPIEQQGGGWRVDRRVGAPESLASAAPLDYRGCTLGGLLSGVEGALAV